MERTVHCVLCNLPATLKTTEPRSRSWKQNLMLRCPFLGHIPLDELANLEQLMLTPHLVRPLLHVR